MTSIDRRRFLKSGFGLMAACLSLPLWQLLTGCNQEGSQPVAEPLSVPLAMVPVGQRTRLENNGRPVELLRTDKGITARSLLCTHQGCKVRWYEERQLYICPCHDGKYDAQGNVVYGMPRNPLTQLPVSIQGGLVVVGG